MLSSNDKIALALEALSMLKDWSIWLVSIQTAVIGFLGIHYRNSIKDDNIRLMKICILGFLISIIFAALSLGGIPSVASQIIVNETITTNVLAMNFQKWLPIKLFWLTYIELASFFVGIGAFARLMFLEIKKDKPS